MADPEFIKATLTHRGDSAEDIAVFIFEPESELDWEPGQYATIGIMGKEKRVERPYSIASSPHEKVLELFVEHVPDGDLTPLFWKLKVGDTITVRPKLQGTFTMDRESGRKTHLMIATVTGAAPYISIVRKHVENLKVGKDEGHRFIVIHGGSRSWELTYLDELNRLQESVDWLTYIPTVSRPWEDVEWTGEKGRAEDIVRKYFDPIEGGASAVTAYLCGHPGMIDSAGGILRRAGMDKAQIREEIYFNAPATKE